MAKYLFVFHGGTPPAGKDEMKEVMNKWGAWMGSLGAGLVDGGNPVGQSFTVQSNGALVEGGGPNPASGYSLIEASSMDDAHGKAKGCPHLAYGGTIEIAEAIDM